MSAKNSTPPAINHAKDSALQKFREAHRSVQAVYQTVVASIKRGYTASVSLRNATRTQQEHEQKTTQLARELAQAQETLKHRTSIANNYTSLITRYAQDRAQQKARIELVNSELEEQEAQLHACEETLQSIQAENAKKLAPYKELMDVAKAHSDELAVKLADIKRTCKQAENACQEAKKRRDREIEDAHHSCDHARERLAHIQMSLSTMQNDPSASKQSLHKMQSELAACRAHADRAFEDIETVTSKHEQLIARAQDALMQIKTQLSESEKQAESARSKANTERESYEALFKTCKQAEQQLQDAINELAQQHRPECVPLVL